VRELQQRHQPAECVAVQHTVAGQPGPSLTGPPGGRKQENMWPDKW